MLLYFSTSLILAVYLILIIRFAASWTKIEEFKGENISINADLRISVVIAAKNEEKNIKNLLNSLKNQSLASKRFQIVLINDHSTDRTLEKAQQFAKTFENLQIFSLENGKNGKKAAINYGISQATGNLIVATDADCQHHEDWLITIAEYYSHTKAKLIISPVVMQHVNSFETMQSLDFFSLMASGAAAAGMQQAIMCNGANLIFEKHVYYEFNDIHNSKYVSGDDIFLLLNVKKKYKNDIKFLKSKKAVVKTKAEKTFKNYVKQRQRWASKSTGYTDWFIIFVAFSVLFVHISMLASLIFGFFYKKMIILFVLQFFFKSIVDFLFLQKTTKYFNQVFNVKILIITQLANIFLIPYFAISGLFETKKWK